MSGNDWPINAVSIPLSLWRLIPKEQEASVPAAEQREKDSWMAFGVRTADIKPQFP